MTKTIENICEWYSIVKSMNQVEGELKRCYYECDGFNCRCYNYIPRIKKKKIVYHHYKFEEDQF